MADGSRQSRLAAAKKKVRGRWETGRAGQGRRPLLGSTGPPRIGAAGPGPRWAEPGLLPRGAQARPARRRRPARSGSGCGGGRREPPWVRRCGRAFPAGGRPQPREGGRGEAGPGLLRCCAVCLAWFVDLPFPLPLTPPFFSLPPPPPPNFSPGAARPRPSRRDAPPRQSHTNGKVSWSSSGFHFEILRIMGSFLLNYFLTLTPTGGRSHALPARCLAQGGDTGVFCLKRCGGGLVEGGHLHNCLGLAWFGAKEFSNIHNNAGKPSRIQVTAYQTSFSWARWI